MKKSASESGIEGRIVNVSSTLHAYGYKEGIRFDKINDEKRYTFTCLNFYRTHTHTLYLLSSLFWRANTAYSVNVCKGLISVIAGDN